jgi:hypothetical protein
MRKSLALTISLIIVFLFAVGCSQGDLKPNDSIATEISKIQNTENGISLDSYADSWDNVLIDSSYDVKTAVENLKIKNAEKLSVTGVDDTLVIAFIKDNSITEYALIDNKSKEVFDILFDYMYQNTNKIYPKGTLFEKN